MMDEYLELLFGKTTGYVAVAAKNGPEVWEETTFRWPREHAALTAWVKDRAGWDVFVCPALRKGKGRSKGDMVGTRWLWADVDWDKVPTRVRDDVTARIRKIGAYVVASGTDVDGRPNVHVYVALKDTVDATEHMRLNTGLRAYLYADFKQADNSLLRLPGTRNMKGGNGGVPVRRVSGHGKQRDAASLTTVREFAEAARMVAKMSSEGVTWATASLADIPVKARRVMRMEADEAVSRYGSRHKAVWAAVGDLVRYGCNEDQIHTIMENFEPAIAKNHDEHGAYDVHRDVDRRLMALSHAQAIVDGTDDVRHTHDDGEAFEELTDEEVASLGTENEMVRRELERRDARRTADQIEAMRRFMPPPPDVSWSVADALANPPDEMRFLIDELAGVKHNVVITAQYKVGKTAFTTASLARALCDGEKFLGRFAVPEDGRVVGHWNCEMEGRELLDDYIRPAGFKHPERLHVANLRGYGINILSETGKAWTVEWLKSRGVQVWTIDSLARLLRMAGVSEKENDEVLNVLMAVDEIKVLAGVDVTFIIAHTGRADMAEGQERARGATVIDDWADARWIMTRVDDVRFLGADGRGVGLNVTSLDFNHETKVSTLGVGGKDAVRADADLETILDIVRANPGCGQKVLFVKFKERTGHGVDKARQLVTEAIECGRMRIDRVSRPGGGRATHTHWPVDAGRNDEDGASKIEVDFRRETPRKRRR